MKLQGVINEDKNYQAFFVPKLTEYTIDDFSINSVKGYGSVKIGENIWGYSKWISPKRSRSYPFAQIYNTYQLPKRVTIIPIIKDEGIRGDNDRINSITLSWMNLLNVHIILAWYEDASRKSTKEGKVTSQKLSDTYVREKLKELDSSQLTPLEWNLKHFRGDFVDIYLRAVNSYEDIAQKTGVIMHSKRDHIDRLSEYIVDEEFDLSIFQSKSLLGSKQAAHNETATKHIYESLGDGEKAYINIQDHKGGEYHLTVDDVYYEGEELVLQESKNSTKAHLKLPSPGDIKDGLLKRTLYSNIDELYMNDSKVEFISRLKLTGNVTGSLLLPASSEVIRRFVTENQFSPSRCAIIGRLNEEAQRNHNLSILITGNT